MRALRLAACACALGGLVLSGRAISRAQNVSYDEILHSANHAENWITYGGNYA